MTTDTFRDAAGRCFIAGMQVPQLVWERFGEVQAVASLYEATLEAIQGPSDAGIYIGAYRDAGGGYEGLQAMARAALRHGRDARIP